MSAQKKKSRVKTSAQPRASAATPPRKPSPARKRLKLVDAQRASARVEERLAREQEKVRQKFLDEKSKAKDKIQAKKRKERETIARKRAQAKAALAQQKADLRAAALADRAQALAERQAEVDQRRAQREQVKLEQKRLRQEAAEQRSSDKLERDRARAARTEQQQLERARLIEARVAEKTAARARAAQQKSVLKQASAAEKEQSNRWGASLPDLFNAWLHVFRQRDDVVVECDRRTRHDVESTLPGTPAQAAWLRTVGAVEFTWHAAIAGEVRGSFSLDPHLIDMDEEWSEQLRQSVKNALLAGDRATVQRGRDLLDRLSIPRFSSHTSLLSLLEERGLDKRKGAALLKWLDEDTRWLFALSSTEEGRRRLRLLDQAARSSTAQGTVDMHLVLALNQGPTLDKAVVIRHVKEHEYFVNAGGGHGVFHIGAHNKLPHVTYEHPTPTLGQLDFALENLTGHRFSGMRLDSANLCGSRCEGGHFSKSTLSGACLRYAHLAHAQFQAADLSHADLAYADLSGADFRKANLTGTNFERANLAGANFAGAVVAGTKFPGAIVRGIKY
jgi:hypothetical protein